MTPYLVQPRNQIFTKCHGFLSFAKNMVRIIGKNKIENLSSKYSQKPLDHTKKSATDALKTASKRVVQKAAEVTSDLTGNKIADKITKVLNTSPQNNSGANEDEILKERSIFPELRHNNIDDLTLMIENY